MHTLREVIVGHDIGILNHGGESYHVGTLCDHSCMLR
jgi:hypothetical protein